MKNFLAIIFSLLFISVFAQKEQISRIADDLDIALEGGVVDGLVKYNYLDKDVFSELYKKVAETDLTDLPIEEKVSFYINAYNIVVINEVLNVYPVTSVQEIGGFFDRKKHVIATDKMTLNDLEKLVLLKIKPDPRLHFALICGALDCPKIAPFAYRSDQLNDQLDARTSIVLNDDLFIKPTRDGYAISQIFNWYERDFGGSKSKVIEFINTYRIEKLVAKNVSFYDYDWTLNDYHLVGGGTDQSNNAYRYVTSAAIPKGGIEFKIFNNLYSQNDGQRSNFFTTLSTLLYGVNNRFNIGFISEYRRVTVTDPSVSPLGVFRQIDGRNGRQRFTSIGPMIRWAPVASLSGFSLQSSFQIPLGDRLQGYESTPFIDWDSAVFWTQFFYDQSLGNDFSLFLEADVLLEDIGAGHSNNLSFPLTGILSWFPHKKVTIYSLLNFAPSASVPFDYFYQVGLGFKYQITPRFEVELLTSSFSNRYLNDVNGNAATYNIGFRYSR